MTARSVKLTPAAEADLDDIWFSIASQSSIERADGFLDALTARFRALSTAPRAGRARPELAEDLRSFAFRKYVIFYSLDVGGVVVERVLHGARDLPRLFRSR